jgi:hypothetical protein
MRMLADVRTQEPPRNTFLFAATASLAALHEMVLENIVVFLRRTRQHIGIARGHEEMIRGFAVHPTNPMEFVSYNDEEFTVYALLQCCECL